MVLAMLRYTPADKHFLSSFGKVNNIHYFLNTRFGRGLPALPVATYGQTWYISSTTPYIPGVPTNGIHNFEEDIVETK